jgi:hypothetical protein
VWIDTITLASIICIEQIWEKNEDKGRLKELGVEMTSVPFNFFSLFFILR